MNAITRYRCACLLITVALLQHNSVLAGERQRPSKELDYATVATWTAHGFILQQVRLPDGTVDDPGAWNTTRGELMPCFRRWLWLDRKMQRLPEPNGPFCLICPAGDIDIPSLASHLKDFKNLEAVKLTGFCGDSRLKALTDLNLKNLRYLSFQYEVTHTGLGELERLPGLEILALQKLTLGRKSLAALSRLKSLKELQLYECDIPDDAVEQLASLQQIHSLHIRLPSDGPAELPKGIWKTIAKLKSLKHLTLARVPEFAASAPAAEQLFRGLQDLRSLRMILSNISDDALDALPNLKNLEVLELSRPLTDSQVSKLTQLRKLRTLVLDGRKVTDKGMGHIARLSSLRSLSLQHVRLSQQGVAELAKLDKLDFLDLYFADVPDDFLRFLRNHKHLKELHLWGVNLSDKGIAGITRFDKLEVLDLFGTQITDKGLAPLAKLQSLRYLYLQRTKVSTAGLLQLAPLQLMYLGLPHGSGPGIRRGGKTVSKGRGDAELKALLACLRPPQHLDLSAWTITDEGAKEFRDQKQLRYLSVANTAITDAGVKSICDNLVGLVMLDLDNTKITDRAIASLCRLPRLRWLSVRRTQISETGMQVLQNALRDCHVLKN